MVTRIRIEAEGASPQEVEEILHLAHEAVGNLPPGTARRVMFGDADQALVQGQAGEFVIERFARESSGAIVYRGRMTSHYAEPAKVVKLGRRTDVMPYAS